MKKLRSILVLGSSVIIILALIVVHDYKKPDCVEAQTCVNAFSSTQIQRCGTGNCVKCGSLFCSMALRSNQACVLHFVLAGDLGAGNDESICRISGTTVTATGFRDYRVQCGGTCINFL